VPQAFGEASSIVRIDHYDFLPIVAEQQKTKRQR
jgi:hypothetical protein